MYFVLWIYCFYQFELLGKALYYKAGYNVLILLQPGYGVAGNFNGENPPPLTLEHKVYLKYAVIDRNDLKSLFNSVIKKQLKSWYSYFDKLFDIPHTMMTELEVNNYVGLLNTIAKAYLESDISWNQALKIGSEILQGETFDNAVNKLGLIEKVSPDLSVILSVMGKEVIINLNKLSD